MQKKRFTLRQVLSLGLTYAATRFPRFFFALGAAMTLWWLACTGVVIAIGRPDLIAAVMFRVGIYVGLSALGAVMHRVVGNEDQAWTHYMFWKKRGGR